MSEYGLNPEFHLPSNIADLDLKTPLPEGKTGIVVLDAANKSMEEVNQKIKDAEERAQQAEEKSMIDSLTGCYNQNFYENFQSNNFDKNRDNNDLGLVFVDVNNLKKTNDTLSHTAGDVLIKKTAEFLKSNFRREDLVVRLGGDEFVVICRNHENDPDFKNNLPQKITERLNHEPPTDFAFGIAVYDKDQDEKGLIDTKNRADILMYQNKAQKKAQNQTSSNS